MANGSRVVLLNHDNIYEALYVTFRYPHIIGQPSDANPIITRY